ncbi:MAG: class I tRNA ligase family protein [Aquificaceae bacterium]|nr:class I tRNA ligase family protein [Aquificaceae bacterium]MDW8236990.1 class I tRNA ligase family protein [Aquificaceae bacterium]
MTIGEFLRSKGISPGDNASLLLEALGLSSLLSQLESRFGEPAKMSKSKGNVVDPSSVIERFGADSVRLYVLFVGPIEKDFEWTDEGLQGAHRFLRRLWHSFHSHLELIKNPQDGEPSKAARELRGKAHKTLEKYRRDMQEMSFNTAIASLMELLNEIQRIELGPQDSNYLKEVYELLLLMLYPFAPHISEELWSFLRDEPLFKASLPEPDPSALSVDWLEIPVQINGKLRDVIKAPAGASQEEVLNLAYASEKLSTWLSGQTPKRVIYVPGRALNIVI